MKKHLLYKLLFLGLGILSFGISFAQKDTTKKGGIDIVSSFKPVLRESAKLILMRHRLRWILQKPG